MNIEPILTSTPAPAAPGASDGSTCPPWLRSAFAEADGGWLAFDRFMALALYAPGHGYYASGARQFGRMPNSGSDFVTAPELTPLFGQALSRQVAQALDATGTDEVWEFGAGSGALAGQLLDTLRERVRRYCIVDLSAALRERQQHTLARHAAKVDWIDALPDRFSGVVVGNEVLDAMPVKLVVRRGDHDAWQERGVVLDAAGQLTFADRPSALRPPMPIGPTAADYLTETHGHAEAFIRTIATQLERGAAFFIDYGFPAREYYHPQRDTGTVMCHRGHRADADPLAHVGAKDITAHVDFTGVAMAGQDAGMQVLGYTSQARFLMNCGLLSLQEQQPQTDRAPVGILLLEHEMGELFKAIGFAAAGSEPFDALGFAQGDRSHTL